MNDACTCEEGWSGANCNEFKQAAVSGSGSGGGIGKSELVSVVVVPLVIIAIFVAASGTQ